MHKVIVIAGPTASGKTSLSIELAKKIDGEIVSADSMQIYKYMDIGTAKPTIEERQGIPHHLLDIVEPDEEFSVARYKDMAANIIDDIINRGKTAIIAGGTGLYINSLIYNYSFSEIETDWGYREELNKLADEKGAEYLYGLLKGCDPESAERIHPNNMKRVIRALEVFHTTGRAISSHQADSRRIPAPYDYRVFGLWVDRELLYQRIDSRVDTMIKNGLIDEVEGILHKGYKPDSIALQALGYKEVISYLKGEISIDEAVYIIKRDTRHFAKRQFTWFKRISALEWIDTADEKFDSQIKKIHDCLA